MPFSTKGMLLAVIGGTDYRRWARAENLKDRWNSRTQLIASLVPAGSHVIEFGAGKRQLEQHIHPSCTYLPSDIVDRGPGSLIIDLNADVLIDLGPHGADTAVFSGVLEYVHDLPRLFPWLGQHVRRCVFSYHCARSPDGSLRRFGERVHRTGHGWFNAYSRNELSALWTSAGFVCVNAIPWSRQTIFVLEKSDGDAGR